MKIIKIILISLLSIIMGILVCFLIPMINYVVTFQPMYSFMRLDYAIAVVVILSILILCCVSGIMMLIFIRKRKK